jgi:hypothetical protein
MLSPWRLTEQQAALLETRALEQLRDEIVKLSTINRDPLWILLQMDRRGWSTQEIGRASMIVQRVTGRSL